MRINWGYFTAKICNLLNRPALRDCHLDKTVVIGSGSNCIKLSMGRYSYMGHNNSVVNAEIGAFCSIASYCALGGSGHFLERVSTSPLFAKGHNAFHKSFASLSNPMSQPVHIGNDVWVGEAVYIKQGIHIGNGVIIGAHSVVTHNIPDYAIVAGIPAKIIRYRFEEKTIQNLLTLKWWNWPEKKLIQYGAFFDNPDKLFAAAINDISCSNLL